MPALQAVAIPLLAAMFCTTAVVAQCDYRWLPAPQNCTSVPSSDNQGYPCEGLFDVLPTSTANVDDAFTQGGPEPGVGDYAAPDLAPEPSVTFVYASVHTFNAVCFQQRLKTCQRAAWLAVISVNDTHAVTGLNFSLPRDNALHCYPFQGARLMTASSVTVALGKVPEFLQCNTGGRTLTFADASCFASQHHEDETERLSQDPATYEAAWLRRCPLALPSLAANASASQQFGRSVIGQDGFAFSGILRDVAPLNLSNLTARALHVPRPGTTAGAFHNGVFYKGSIYLVPLLAHGVVKVDVATGQAAVFDDWTPTGMNGARQNKFIGAVADAGYIWLVPLHASYPVRVHPELGNMTAATSWPSQVSAGEQNKFTGGVSDGVSMWMIPSDAKAVVRLFYDDLTMVGYDGWPGSHVPRQFSGGVLARGCLWLVPHAAKTFFCLDVAAGVFHDATERLWSVIPQVAQGQRGMYVGGTFDGEQLWLLPSRAYPAAVVTFAPSLDGEVDDPQSVIARLNVSAISTGSLPRVGGATDGSTVWMGPAQQRQPLYCNAAGLPGFPASTFCAEYDDAVVRSVEAIRHPFRGVIFDGSTMWFVPNGGDRMVGITGNVSRPPSRVDTLAEVRAACGAAACDGLQDVYDDVEGQAPGARSPLLLQSGTGVSGLATAADVQPVSSTAPHATTLTDWPGRIPPPLQNKFRAGAVMGGWLFLAPLSASAVVAVNVVTGAMVEYAKWPYTYRCTVDCFSGVVADAGAVWLVPQSSDRVIRLDPVSGEMVGVSGWPAGVLTSSNNFFGGASDGSSLFMVPLNSAAVARLRYADRTIAALRPWPAGFNQALHQKFRGGVITRNGTLWLVPAMAPQIVLVDTRTGQGRYLVPGLPPATRPDFGGAVVVDAPGDQLVVLLPQMNKEVVAFSAASGEERGRVTVASSSRQFVGGAFDGTALWLAPAASPTVQVVNISTAGELTLGPAHRVPAPAIGSHDHYKFAGAAFDGTAVWFIPLHSPAVLRMGCGPLQHESPPANDTCKPPPRLTQLSVARRDCLLRHTVTSLADPPKGGGERSATLTLDRPATRSSSPSTTQPRTGRSRSATLRHSSDVTPSQPHDQPMPPPTEPVRQRSPSPSQTQPSVVNEMRSASVTRPVAGPLPATLTATASLERDDRAAVLDRDERSSERVARVTAPVAAGTAVVAAVFSPTMAARAPAFAGVTRARRCGSPTDADDAAFWEFPIQPTGLVEWAGHAAVAGAVVNVAVTVVLVSLAAVTTVARPMLGMHTYAALAAGLVTAYFIPTIGTAVAAGTADSRAASIGAAVAVGVVAAVTFAAFWRLVWIQHRPPTVGHAGADGVVPRQAERALWSVVVPLYRIGTSDTTDSGLVNRWRDSFALRKSVFFLEVFFGAAAALLGTAAGAARSHCLTLGVALVLGPGLGAIVVHTVLRPFGPDAKVDTIFAALTALLVMALGGLVVLGALDSIDATVVEEYGEWMEVLASGVFFAQPFAAVGYAWRKGELCHGSRGAIDRENGSGAGTSLEDTGGSPTYMHRQAQLRGEATPGSADAKAPLLATVPVLDGGSGASLHADHQRTNPLRNR